MTETRLHAPGLGNNGRYGRGCRCHECRDAHAHVSLVALRRYPEKRHAIRHTACPECGGEMSRGNGTDRDPTTCRDCYDAERAPAHGTHSRYTSPIWRCRCDLCRAANTDLHRSLIGKPAPSHGVSGYVNYGCRCDVCRAAGSARNKANREKRMASRVSVRPEAAA